MNDSAGLLAGARAGVSVSVEGVDLSYGGNHVLKDVSVDIGPGELFGFLGPSGCGKTTLLRLIAGFNKADRGRVRIDGRDISHLPPWKRDVGMVFQSYALWPHMTVAKNVAFGLEERRVPRATIAAKVQAALELVDLQGYGDRRPSQLSGGQQQRVAVARTIAVEPKVLLLDEPLSNLDANLRGEVRRELRQLQQRLGLTTIFVTHDQEEANTICDRIAVMNEGRIAQVGTPLELYRSPANVFVARFIGSANILEGRLVETAEGRSYDLENGPKVPVALSGDIPAGAKLAFRSHSAVINSDAAASGFALPGKIVHSEFLGPSVRYTVLVGASEVLVDVPFRSGDRLHPLEAPVNIGLASSDVLWIGE